MITEQNKSGNYAAWQPLNETPRTVKYGRTLKKVGFVCDAETPAEAIDGVIKMFVKHCVKNGESPSAILDHIS
jgi:hypothetical protein